MSNAGFAAVGTLFLACAMSVAFLGCGGDDPDEQHVPSEPGPPVSALRVGMSQEEVVELLGSEFDDGGSGVGYYYLTFHRHHVIGYFSYDNCVTDWELQKQD